MIDLTRLRDAQDALVDFASPDWASAVGKATDADVVGAFRLGFESDVMVELNEWINCDPALVAARLRSAYRLVSFRTPNWNPRKPALRQANRVVRSLQAPIPHAARATFEEYDRKFTMPLGLPLARYGQVRSLLFHGPLFLGWFGGVRHGPFGSTEARMFAKLLPYARARLLYLSRSRDASVEVGAFEALLQRTSGVVVRTDRNGHIVDASPCARALYDQDLPRLRARMRDAAHDGGAETIPIADGHKLVFLRHDASSAGSRLQTFARMWRLTPRELDVARFLLEGLSTKEIAAEVGAAPGTVEIHVGRVLRKASVDTRARFIARFWAQ